MEKGLRALKRALKIIWQQMRSDAITAAADAVAGGNISKLAGLIKEEPQDLHNWLRRGSKLSEDVGAKLSKSSGVSLYLLRPAEPKGNNQHYDDYPKLIIFDVEVLSIDVTLVFNKVSI